MQTGKGGLDCATPMVAAARVHALVSWCRYGGGGSLRGAVCTCCSNRGCRRAEARHCRRASRIEHGFGLVVVVRSDHLLELVAGLPPPSTTMTSSL